MDPSIHLSIQLQVYTIMKMGPLVVVGAVCIAYGMKENKHDIWTFLPTSKSESLPGQAACLIVDATR